MTGICGWVGGTEASAAADALMASALDPFHHSRLSTCAVPGASAAVLQRGRADLHRGADHVVAICGYPDILHVELAAQAGSQGLAAALAEGYRRFGPDLLRHVSGSFALAILEPARRRALLAVDRIGVAPLFYETAGGKLTFASSLDAISRCPGSRSDLSHQALYAYVHFHMVPGPHTVYAHRRRLLPGNYLLWDNGAAKTVPYWEMRYVENRTVRFADQQAEFLALLRKAVARCAEEPSTGAFLSGGTDSSTVAGMLGLATGRPAHTYSIGFEAQGYDETGYARTAARHFGTEHHEYYVSPDDVVRAVPAIAAVHDQPFGNSSAVPTYYCAKLARENGITTLLGGDGGDELFGGNSRYARQWLFSLYSDLPEGLRTQLLEPAAFAFSPRILGKVQRFIRKASQPMPLRYDDYNLLLYFGPENVFTAEFLESVNCDEPHDLLAADYGKAHAQTLINRMLALDLKYTLADNDLPKVVRSAQLAGVETRFPLLDDEIVAFSATLAPQLKLKRTQLRYFFKRALREFLPPEVIAKEKHGFGLPFGLWLRTHRPLEQLAFDNLADLRKRQIVRGRFIDELVSKHLATHPAYFGTMVWVFMMLEQWFAHRASGAAGTTEKKSPVLESNAGA